MSRKSKGFTLIELVVVIAILGILAAVAIPKFIDLSGKAKKAADESYVGGLRSATLLLYASNCLSGTMVTNNPGVTNYWPTYTQVTNQMTEGYSLQYYGTNVYDCTNGAWSLSGLK